MLENPRALIDIFQDMAPILEVINTSSNVDGSENMRLDQHSDLYIIINMSLLCNIHIYTMLIRSLQQKHTPISPYLSSSFMSGVQTITLAGSRPRVASGSPPWRTHSRYSPLQNPLTREPKSLDRINTNHHIQASSSPRNDLWEGDRGDYAS